MHILRGIIGIAGLLGIAYILSNNRKKINLTTVAWGVGLQIVLGLIVLKTPFGKALFSAANDVVLVLLSYADKGSGFVFGALIDNSLVVEAADKSVIGSAGLRTAFFAFKVLPTILFFSALMSILYYLGLMQKIIQVFAVLMSRTMQTSGSESLSVAANIFVGQTEAPLVVRPYVASMTKSELNAVMAGGFATVAGGVMAAYVGFLKDVIPGIAGHLMTASIMSAPAALVMAKIIFPETEKSKTEGKVKLDVPVTDANIVDAAANGTLKGLELALNVGAMLIAFIALVALCDGLLGLATSFMDKPLTLNIVLGWLGAPLAWLMGVPAADVVAFGHLLGTKIMINEFVAYVDLAEAAKTFVSPRSAIIASYALCGFANVSSIGIQIGGIGSIAPNRRQDLARIAPRALIAGALASFMTATIAGVLIG
ncbi:MAG: nucleoside transporter C-terminal domain-containing protein [Elusimicrobiota bacterium]